MRKISKINFNKKYNKKDNTKEKIEKRYKILIVIICFILGVLFFDLFYVQIIKNDVYINKVNQLTKNIIYGTSTPRGRIYDRNGNILVDNEAIKIISYKKRSGISTKEEIKMAYLLGSLIELELSGLSKTELKLFWLKNNPELGKAKITEDEWKKLEERKITSNDIEKYKLERITEEDLKEYTDEDRKAALIYTLMNKGYSYSEKTIKKNTLNSVYSRFYYIYSEISSCFTDIYNFTLIILHYINAWV